LERKASQNNPPTAGKIPNPVTRSQSAACDSGLKLMADLAGFLRGQYHFQKRAEAARPFDLVKLAVPAQAKATFAPGIKCLMDQSCKPPG